MHEHHCKKAVLNRMARAIGHMNAIKKMIEEDRDCGDILIQLSAVRSEITNAGKVLLKEHLEHCVVEAVQQNDAETIEKLMVAVDKML